MQLTGLVSEVHQQSTDDTSVNLNHQPYSQWSILLPKSLAHPVGHTQGLSLGSLSTLQCLLDSAQRFAVQRLSRGDDDLEFSSVGSDERVEVGKDLLGG